MSSVNKIFILGRLGADPELRSTQGGQSVCNLRVATSENWKDKDGNRQERTEWHSVTVWGRQGEMCGEYLAKGRQVYVEGRLQSREYEKDGQTRKVWDIVASNVVFIGGRNDGAAPAAGGNQPKQSWGQGGGQPKQSWGQGGGQGQNRGGGQSQSGGWGNKGGQNQGGGQGGWGNQGGNQGGNDGPIPF
tara:strand:- start:4422 stop:4988 length:567 start_codon:yes stop_codon:yes gene_type:complete